jgi:helicase, putative, RecD/TraA family
VETIKGEVARVIFKNESTGFRVFIVKPTHGKAFSVTGEFGPEVIIGTVANFHGDYKAHAKYGTSFRVTSYNILHNKEELNSIRLFIDTIAPNIGPGRAQLIVSRFGSDTFNIIENSPEKLLEIPGIGDVSTQSLSEAWTSNKKLWLDSREQYSLRAFLYSLGIKEKRVKKIISFYGGGMNAEESIRNDPYALTQIDGFGFTTADYVAKQVGLNDSDPARLTALILYGINVLCPSNGHLYLTKLDIVDVVNKYAQETPTTFIGKPIITLADIKTPIDELKEKGLIHIDEDKIYSKPCFTYESQSASILARIMEKKSDLIAIDDKEIEDFIKVYERENTITLSKEQKDALYLFNREKVFVITGCPGTGKTTILKAIVELVLRLRLNLTCMTPTGISAKKMSETIKFDAYTIHRRLGYRGGEWTCGELNKFETDVVLVDESSMVDQEVFYRMLSALRDRVHIIFVGDHHQLPSVGAGNVLRELINSEQVPVIKLEQIFRQDEASDIIRVAHKIKNGDNNLDLFKPDPKADVFFYREKDVTKIEKMIIGLAQKFKDERRVFQIFSPRNQGPLSVDSLNTLLQNVLNPAAPDLAEIKCFNFTLRRGDRVIVKKNDYENDIFNGDIGKVIRIGGGFINLLVDERDVQLAIDEIEGKIKLAYAISVHSSQGQEYKYVILPFINQYGRNMLQRNLLYTAITRAKEKVIVIGHASALERAINNSSVHRRNTKLGERIKECTQLRRKGFSATPQSELEDSQIVELPKEPSSLEESRFCPSVTVEKSSENATTRYQEFMTQFLEQGTQT